MLPIFRKKVKKYETEEERRAQMIARIEGRMAPPDPNIRYSLDISAFEMAEKKLNKWKEEHKTCTFQEELIDRIAEKKMTSVSFYKKAHMDRKLFSAISSKKDYNPKKETAIACCLALKLNLDETRALLEKAGLALSDAKQWDVLIKHCISCGYYDIDDVNFILDHFGEKPLGC